VAPPLATRIAENAFFASKALPYNC